MDHRLSSWNGKSSPTVSGRYRVGGITGITRNLFFVNEFRVTKWIVQVSTEVCPYAAGSRSGSVWCTWVR